MSKGLSLVYNQRGFQNGDNRSEIEFEELTMNNKPMPSCFLEGKVRVGELLLMKLSRFETFSIC